MTTSSSILIEGATLIDGTGGPALSNATLLIRGDRIQAVQSGPLKGLPDGLSERIDATGKTVMPGLIDAHCHMTYGESRSEEEIDLYTSVESRTLRAAWNAALVLRAGVTSISQPGGSYYIGVALRDAIAQGRVQGPRMATAGRYLTTSNGLTDFFPDHVGNPAGAIGIVTNTVAEMINEVRHQVKNGVDFIKLADSPFGEYQAFTYDEMRTVTDLAHQLGKKATIHARGSAEVNAAARAGFDWIMHGNVMDDGTIEVLAHSKIPLVPTLLLLANWADWGHLVDVPDPVITGSRQMLDLTAKSLHKAREAGVTIVTGTDTGFALTPYGEWHARELELLMTYAGMSASEAICSATRDAAVTVGLEGEVGILKAGKLADVIIVNGNPLDDIRVLQDKNRIETIIKGGEIQTFLPNVIEQSWAHERSQHISLELTHKTIEEAGLS